MSLTFKARFFTLVGWQVLLLLALMASKFVTLATGTTVILSTVPVDPRELFRGDYVALRYGISQLELDRLDQRVTTSQLQQGSLVYVVLAPPAGKQREPWEAVALFGRAPTGEELAAYQRGAISLRGRVVQLQGKSVELEYGIESYFVPEGEGRKLEQANAEALTIEVKVDSRGHAAIRQVLLQGKPVR